jgi:hypothetical protein
MTGIEKYSGSDKVRDLEMLVHQFLDYFEMTNLLGLTPEADCQQILLLGTKLGRYAQEFYNKKISGCVEDWTFIEVVQALEAQFLPLTLYESAWAHFDLFWQQSQENVLQYYTQLKEYSDALLYEASPYDMKHQFFNGIQAEICGQLAHDNCTPEKSWWKLRDMLKMAINIEEGLNKAKSQTFVHGVNMSGVRREIYNNCPQENYQHADNNQLKVHNPIMKDWTKPTPKLNPVAAKSPGKVVSKEAKLEDTCFWCSKKGHWADKCQSKGKPIYHHNMIVMMLYDEMEVGSQVSDEEAIHSDAPDDGSDPISEDEGNRTNEDDPIPGKEEDANYLSDNYFPHIGAMTCYELDNEIICSYQAQQILEGEPLLHQNWARTKDRKTNWFAGPESECISGYITINGHRAHVLVDTGSEVQLMLADFGWVAGVRVQQLEKAIGLQLATVGSHTSINYGCETEITIGQKRMHTYWDIGKIDYFDAILRIQALWALGCVIYAVSDVTRWYSINWWWKSGSSH